MPSWLAVSDMDCAMLVAGGADALDGLKTLLQSQKEAVRWSLSSIQLAPGTEGVCEGVCEAGRWKLSYTYIDTIHHHICADGI